VYVQDGGLLYFEDSATLTLRGLLYVDGGTVRLANYSIPQLGRFRFNYGTVQLAGNHIVGDDDLAIGDIFGGSVNITSGKNLVIEGAATLSEPAIVDGGTFTVGQLVNAPFLDLKRGTLTLTNQPVTVQSDGLFGDQLQLKPDGVINVNQGTTNRGLIWGNGTLGGPVLNDIAGEIRASAADTLTFEGATTNSGDVRLIGGLVDFHSTLTNTAGGRITGRGTLIARSGLNNLGHVALSSGISDVYGDVVNDTSNAAVGITVSGQADANFWGDVTNASGLFRVSDDASATFFGNFSGGGISGGGDVYFEADLSPGSSPGIVPLGGNVAFGPNANLLIEISGATPGGAHDQLQVADHAALDGTLKISLTDAFTPSPGHVFEIMTYASRSGSFSAITGDFYFGDGMFLDEVYGSSSLSLVMTQASAGDADLDGDVDINDLSILAGNYGAAGDLDWVHGDFDHDAVVTLIDLTLLATHYEGGQAQAFADFQSMIPEPSTIAILAITGIFGQRRNHR
jgi:hypothetical protein